MTSWVPCEQGVMRIARMTSPRRNELPCEPADHEVIATGSAQSCKEIWRTTFVRSAVVMEWIENNYRLL